MVSNQDPLTKHEQPKFPAQSQDAPGLDSQMDPKPDWGETSYKGANKLKGKQVVITGGDSGIGRAVAIAYAHEGCASIAISYLNEHSDAEDTKKMVEKIGAKVVLIPGDISTDPRCKNVIDTAMKTLKQVDILVLNAAYQGRSVKHVFDLDYHRISHAFHTNIIAMFMLAKYAHPHMKKGSTIITSSSIQGYEPSPEIIDYATTKGAIVNFTKCLAKALISEGIRVNSVAPGPVWTPLIPQSFDKEKVAEFGKQSPMGRPAMPAELSPAYVFLASEDSSYVVGEILAVTGGSITA